MVKKANEKGLASTNPFSHFKETSKLTFSIDKFNQFSLFEKTYLSHLKA